MEILFKFGVTSEQLPERNFILVVDLCGDGCVGAVSGLGTLIKKILMSKYVLLSFIEGSYYSNIGVRIDSAGVIALQN